MTADAGPSSSGPADGHDGPAAQPSDDAPDQTSHDGARHDGAVVDGAGGGDDGADVGGAAHLSASLPSAVPAPPATDDQRVDAALAELAAAVQAPVGDQVEAYVGAHRALHERLADLDG